MLFWILVHYACILPVLNWFLYVKALFGDLDMLTIMAWDYLGILGY